MLLTFLGCGAAFNIGVNQFQSNMLIEDQGKRFLIDCGSDIRHSLHKIGLSYRDISGVYISHLHADHCFGLEWLGLNCFFDKNMTAPELYIKDTLADDLWNHTLKGCMTNLGNFESEFSTYFDIQLINKEDVFCWNGTNFSLVQVVHCVVGDKLIPCYGLFITTKQQKTFISSDTQFTPDRLMSYYKEADLILHDCETSINHSGVHAHYKDLCTLDRDIKSKMWLYHYNDGSLPNAVEDGFAGFISRGQVFEI